MKKRINFSSVKAKAMLLLQGNWLMFALCLIASSLVFMMLVPQKYLLSFMYPQIELNVMEQFRIFVATSISEALFFTLTAAMYRVIFKSNVEEKRGIKLLFANANMVFPSSVIPLLLTKVLLSFLSFLLIPTVSNFLYDYLFISVVDYVVYNLTVLLISLILSVVTIYVTLAYALTPCVIADNPQLSGREAMKISRKLMKKRKFNLIFFTLSFTGWYILGMCAFGIGIFWVHAYVATATYIYYLDLKTA